MKKLIAFTLCAAMALSLAACSNAKPAKDNSQNQTSNQAAGDSVQIPSPFIDCKTIADAEEIAGFTIIVPKTIPAGYSQDIIQAVKDDMVQIIYKNGEQILRFRQGKGNEDISGDYNEYKENNTISVGGLQIITKGNDGKISVATCVSEEFTFAITADGLDSTEFNDMINSMKSDAGFGGDSVQIPSPFNDYNTMDAAGKTAGFTVTVPEKLPKGYAQTLIQASENDMVKVFFENGEKRIEIRKAKGVKDISGVYTVFDESNTVTVGNLNVSTRGNDGKINVATWIDGEYAYSVTANIGETGLDASTISDMVGGIR